MKFTEEFAYQILSIVGEIPYGQVATYGQIAKLSGYEKNARLVGKVLSNAEYFGKFPCHRVVNSSGRCALYWFEQKDLLLEEGIMFKANGCVDLKRFQWNVNGNSE